MTRNHAFLERYLGLQKTETTLLNTLRRARYCESVTIVGVNRPSTESTDIFSVLFRRSWRMGRKPCHVSKSLLP